MPVYQLSDDLIFPHPSLADDDGVLAIGGDLKPERLLLAYSHGIFPWYSNGEPIIWHSPDPRFILMPHELKISKSMEQLTRKGEFKTSFNQAFKEVIAACKNIERPGQEGTWITDEMEAAYIELHKQGFAHSVEVWKNNELVGGLYGVAIANVFCGESMFSRESNASKLALIELVKAHPWAFVDCQVYTDHLASMGAHEIPRADYLDLLARSLKETKQTKNNP